MKYILEGNAQKHPEVLGILTEDVLLNKDVTNTKLSKYKMKIEKIEEVNGEKIVHIKEDKSNLLLG